MEEKKYLNAFNKFGYGTGDFAANMVFGLLSSFVMIYLTNTVGMNPAVIGTLIMVSKFLDGLTDIFFGSIIDRTHTKMGKARPWMLGSFIGNSVCLILLFATPLGMGKTAQYIYFFVTYTLLNAVFYTANNISYSTLTALITRNSNERVQLGTFRFIGSTIGNVVVSNFTLVLVERFGGGATGWKGTAIIFAVIGLIINTFSAFSVKELPEEVMENNEKDVAPKEVGLIDTMRLLLSNKYFDMLAILYTVFYMNMGISMGGAVYFCIYVLGDGNAFGKFATMSSIASVIGLILVPFLIKKFHSIRTVSLGSFSLHVVVRIAFIAAAFTKNIPLMMVLFALSFLTCCSLGGTFNALVAEASEYTYRKTGKRIDGSMYSCTSFGMKVGGGLGSAISGWLLAASGFDAAALVQTTSVNNMLTFMFAVVPLIAGIIVLFIYFKMNVETVNAKSREEQANI